MSGNPIGCRLQALPRWVFLGELVDDLADLCGHVLDIDMIEDRAHQCDYRRLGVLGTTDRRLFRR